MKLLITGAWQTSFEELEAIQAMGHQIIRHAHEKDPLPCPYDEVEGCICNGLFLHHPIGYFTSLRYIQVTSAGFDRVPMDYVRTHNIEIYNAYGVYSIPMAEFAICGVLQLYKQSVFFRDNQLTHHWEKHRNLRELSGRIVCIVGCGSVGTECAKRFAAFNCRVIGIDIVVREHPNFLQIKPFAAFDDLLPIVDVLILTLPLTDSSFHLMNRERFAQMKSGTVLVNISRGAIVNESALLAWLQHGPENGAVLDVFEEEPLPRDNPLWDQKNVLITPHNSFVGANRNRLRELILKNLAAFQ